MVIHGQESKSLPVTAGVPQGSVLGPTLFLVFLSDLGKDISANIDFYADDTTLHRVIKTKAERATAADSLNADLRAIQQWADLNLAKFNPSKTRVLTISRARDAALAHPPLFLGSQRLDEAEHLTIVGLLINNRLSWGDHIRRVTISCSQHLGALRRASFCLPSPALLAAYKGIIRARMEYLSPVWRGGPQTDLQNLHRLQRRALRIMGLADCDPSSLRALRLQPVDERWRISSLALLYRAVTSVAPAPVVDLFPEAKERHKCTRATEATHHRAFKVPRSRTHHHASSFLPWTVRQWNSLPDMSLPGGTPHNELQCLKVFCSRNPVTFSSKD